MNNSIASHAARFATKTFRYCVYLLSAVCCFLFLCHDAGPSAQTDSEPVLRGRVVFSDGMFVPGAKVEATAKCEGFDLNQTTTTAEDGSFSFPVLPRTMLDPGDSEADCKQYRFRASKREDYWLPSDENVFSGVSPTAPTVDLPLKFPLEPVQIVLKVRGGKVSFRVWDVATDRFVRAHLAVNRKPVQGKEFGSMLIKTGNDGSPDTLLLPSGQYSAEVESYPCGTSEYWTAVGPVSPFTVQAADNLDETIRIDVRTIKPLSGDHGRRREKCKP